MRSFLSILVIVGICYISNIQCQEVLPLNFEFGQYIEASIILDSNNHHLSFKPYVKDKIYNKMAASFLLTSYRKKNSTNVRAFHRKLRYDNLISVDTEEFKLRVNPIFNFEVRKLYENSGKYDYINSRGVCVSGFIGKNVFFYSDFYENQVFFSDYLKDFIRKTNVFPGQGLVKTFKKDGFDFSSASGIVSVNLKRYFNVQFGHGKNFIGNGYRSLILSDNSPNYPFLKITTNVWRLQYTNLYTSFLDIKVPRVYTLGFQKKSGSFHYLNFLLGKKLNVGLFEGVIWQNYDSSRTRGFDVNYLNPIIFFRPIEFSLGSPDNAIVGINVSYKIFKSNLFYGQFVLDDINVQKLKEGWGFLQNKYAFQLGFASFKFLNIKNLIFRTEYNHVQPYTYAHKNPIQNYAHYYQPLAHPLGANFIENVNFIHYRWNDFLFSAKFSYSEKGIDTLRTHWGGNIFLSDGIAQRGLFSFGNVVCQGLKQHVLHRDFYISYLINPSYNFTITAGISSRLTYSIKEMKSFTFFYISLKTALNNVYFDF